MLGCFSEFLPESIIKRGFRPYYVCSLTATIFAHHPSEFYLFPHDHSPHTKITMGSRRHKNPTPAAVTAEVPPLPPHYAHPCVAATTLHRPTTKFLPSIRHFFLPRRSSAKISTLSPSSNDGARSPTVIQHHPACNKAA